MTHCITRPCLLSVFFSTLFFGGLSRADEIPPQPVDGKIVWIYRYAEGKDLARETGKPMFVVFRCER